MAKRKLSRDQKRKQKRRQRRERQQKEAAYPRRYQNMIQRLEESGLDKKHKFVYNPPGTAKMSEILREFIEPFRKFANTTDAMHRLLVTALVAWNTALIPEAEREESLKVVSKNLPPDTVEDFYAIVEEMIERKERYFAQYKRYILEYELTETENNYRIAVVSTQDPEEQVNESSRQE